MTVSSREYLKAELSNAEMEILQDLER